MFCAMTIYWRSGGLPAALRAMFEGESDAWWWLVPTLAVVGGLLATAVCWGGDLDLRLAQAVADWNQAHGGKVQDRWWWLLPYRLPAVLLALLGLGLLIAWLKGQRREAIYVMLVLVVGSGLFANLLLKDGWGRPRPRDTIALGGMMVYQQVWERGEAGRGRSFPSGHVTVPALVNALWLLWRRSRLRLARWSLAGGAVVALWIGAARVLAGAHWLTDLVWAVVIMAVTAGLMHRLVMPAARPTRVSAAMAVGP